MNALFAYNGTKEMRFSSFDGGQDGEYNDGGFVVISKTFEMQGACFFGAEPFDK